VSFGMYEVLNQMWRLSAQAYCYYKHGDNLCELRLRGVFGSQVHCIVSRIRNYCYTTFHGAPPLGRVECVCQHHLLSIKFDEVFV
jgi:hypothetical protein